MGCKSFSFKWWWYGQVEDLHNACAKELHELEEKEKKKGHDLYTQKENLPHGWVSVAYNSLTEYSEASLESKKKKKKQSILGPYNCLWESPEHVAIRCRYNGKIFQRRFSYIPQIVGVLGGILGIVSFILQLINII